MKYFICLVCVAILAEALPADRLSNTRDSIVDPLPQEDDDYLETLESGRYIRAAKTMSDTSKHLYRTLYSKNGPLGNYLQTNYPGGHISSLGPSSSCPIGRIQAAPTLSKITAESTLPAEHYEQIAQFYFGSSPFLRSYPEPAYKGGVSYN